MKILFISASFPYLKDGIADSSACVYKEFNNIADIVLLTTNRAEVKEYVKSKGFKKVYYLDSWNFNRKNIKFINEIIKKNDIEAIHIEYPGKGYGKGLLINVLPIFIRLFNKKVKIYMRYHEFVNSRLLRKIVDIPLLIFTQKIFVMSYPDYCVLKKRFKNKIKKVFLGSSFDINNIKQELKERKEEFILGYFGFVYKGKGIEKMLEVLSLVIKQDTSIKLKMICDLDDDDEYHLRIKELIREYNLKDNVIITGYIPREKLEEEFKTIDLATTFFDEGLTLRRSSVFAFMNAGIPIVTSHGDEESLQVFDKDINIFMSDNNDEIVSYILDLRNNIETYNFRCRETSKLSEKFSWKEICKDIYNEYLD